ncbi:Thiamine pyrophosphokinase [Sulfitobacter sp. THAF37]|uniref:thiamine diphosphokinase n=1 Tax=Sulfitobacter sp. THAF37 TaxID=2587855 RepID=UPI001268E27A|nr:thiamine diphosphokinase [Sulfitobacter sp. THAF37]QFT60491.1 Thiamine pyrophosphokinase [Sulfitobacter sp. THAF37]
MNDGIVAKTNSIVYDTVPITLVGGGNSTPQDLAEALTLAPRCVAADGGAGAALAAGVMPEAVIGDFDSLTRADRDALPPEVLHPIAEQDSTDFEKALTRIDAPLVIAVGFTGGRMDHQLAALHTLMVCADRPCVLLGAEEVVFLTPPRIALPTGPGDVVSLFPLGPVSARSTGLHWPLDGLGFAPGLQSGTSNHATGPMTVEVDAPAMLMLLPRRMLRPVATSLSAASAARWPRRAG